MVFEVERTGLDVVEVRWPKALGTLFSEPYAAVGDCLIAIPGVEKVDVLRYSAVVQIAKHVLLPAQAASTIAQILLDDANLAHVLAIESGIETIEVVVR